MALLPPACESVVVQVAGGSVGRNPWSRGGHTHTHITMLVISGLCQAFAASEPGQNKTLLTSVNILKVELWSKLLVNRWVILTFPHCTGLYSTPLLLFSGLFSG